MGIRVHKVLGYGLTDVVCESYRISDPRINPESKFVNDDLWDLEVEDYRDWLKEKSEGGRDDLGNMDYWIMKERLEDSRGRKYSMSDSFVHQAEYGLDNVILLSPVTHTDWRRFDDSIDYVEETYMRERGETQIDRVNVLPHGIYPYSSIYMDCRTGERLKDPHETLWRRRFFHEGITDSDRDGIAKVLGFENFEEANKVIAPIVPREIRDLAEYGELFLDPMGWTQLRPLHYVYWA